MIETYIPIIVSSISFIGLIYVNAKKGKTDNLTISVGLMETYMKELKADVKIYKSELAQFKKDVEGLTDTIGNLKKESESALRTFFFIRTTVQSILHRLNKLAGFLAEIDEDLIGEIEKAKKDLGKIEEAIDNHSSEKDSA